MRLLSSCYRRGSPGRETRLCEVSSWLQGAAGFEPGPSDTVARALHHIHHCTAPLKGRLPSELEGRSLACRDVALGHVDEENFLIWAFPNSHSVYQCLLTEQGCGFSQCFFFFFFLTFDSFPPHSRIALTSDVASVSHHI